MLSRDEITAAFERHAEGLYAYACCALHALGPRARDQGPEVAQEVWLRVLRKAETFSGSAAEDTSLRPWLYGIARNVILEVLRDHSVHRRKTVRTLRDSAL